MTDFRSAIERSWWRPKGAWFSALLAPAAALYGVVWYLRRALVATGLLRPKRSPVPVVVVGNLIAGGAGKTPTVMALVVALRRAGWTPGVVSRGYGSLAGNTAALVGVSRDTLASVCGDEPLLIHLRTGAPVWVGRRRADAVRALHAARPAVDIVVADDGLQHLALPRSAQVVVFDERGVGNGRLLPAGPLREPFTAAVPAHTVVVYNAAAPSTPWPGHVARRGLAGTVPLADWWAGQAPQPGSLQAWRGRTVLAAAGLAVPERFFGMLEAAGLTLVRLPLPDHAAFDVLPWPPGTAAVLVTEKDAVKLRPSSHAVPGAPDTTNVHVVTLDFALPDEALAALLALLPKSKQMPKAKPKPRSPRPT